MKKILLLFLFMAALPALMHCHSQDVKGGYKKCLVYYHYIPEGSQSGPDTSSLYYKTEDRYNNAGYIILEKSWEHDSLVSIKSYRYNSKKHPVKIIVYQGNDSSSYSVMKYDNKDSLTERTDYTNGALSTVEKYTYSDTNHTKKIIYFNKAGKITTVYKYNYHGKTSMTGQELNGDTSLSIEYTDTYNAAGKITYSSYKSYIYTGDGNSSYEYDAKNRLIRQVDYSWDSPGGNYHETKYNYDANNSLIEKNRDDYFITRYSYDSFGNPLKESIFYNNTPSGLTVYIYSMK